MLLPATLLTTPTPFPPPHPPVHRLFNSHFPIMMAIELSSMALSIIKRRFDWNVLCIGRMIDLITSIIVFPTLDGQTDTFFTLKLNYKKRKYIAFIGVYCSVKESYKLLVILARILSWGIANFRWICYRKKKSYGVLQGFFLGFVKGLLNFWVVVLIICHILRRFEDSLRLLVSWIFKFWWITSKTTLRLCWDPWGSYESPSLIMVNHLLVEVIVEVIVEVEASHSSKVFKYQNKKRSCRRNGRASY